ncbi:unnamed protein product [Notodromas monacha]|uniref:Uncharacterized protein n=1 Tax=Notodromas monacha TaxID=399045 RepID=A0A7R9BDI2_9CRUS|nr:unnamed protein product [Notodromas monacha]CAG0912256.1 unnamed protein product [Notodromas monacha]
MFLVLPPNLKVSGELCLARQFSINDESESSCGWRDVVAVERILFIRINASFPWEEEEEEGGGGAEYHCDKNKAPCSDRRCRDD